VAKTKKVIRKATKKPAKAAVKKVVRKKAAPAAGRRMSWLDATGEVPQIETYARRLNSFMDALADGVVDDAELKAQEKRLVKLLREIEPKLDPALHGRVTELLCELTAYDLMQVLHSMHARRPKTVFRG
jgi:hypothetical protein